MRFKRDFDAIVSRMEAWWRGEVLDRACVDVKAPSGAPRRDVPAPPTPRECRQDVDYLLDSAEAGFEATYFAGEAVPVFRPDLGPDLFAALVGAGLDYTETSSWVKPCIADWSRPPSFELDRDSFEWKWHERVYAAAAERAKGAYFVAAPDCHSGGDCLLAMRGATDLCTDLYAEPEAVAAAMRKLERAVVEFHEAWWPLIERGGQRGHTTSWLGVWSPGRSNAVQLDLLALISPAMLREFFLRELEVQCEALDQTIYHLDGPDAVGGAPAICELLDVNRPGSALRGIQWEPGAGNYPMTNWIPLLRDLQSRGAGLFVRCEPREVEVFMRELSSRGLYLVTQARSREEADDVVKLVARLTRD